MSHRHPCRRLAVCLVTLLLITSCGGGGSSHRADDTASQSTKSGDGVSLLKTEAEKQFGLAPTPSKDVTYKDDVVLLPQGPDAIVSASNSGASVILKADAKGIDKVTKGKVLFATGRVVGRVAGVRKTAEGVEVALLPVQLTDVVEKANLTYSQPIDPASMIVYPGQNLGEDSTNPELGDDVPDGAKVVKTTDADGNEVSGADSSDSNAENDSTDSSADSVGSSGESSAPPLGATSIPSARPVSYVRGAADPDPTITTTVAPPGGVIGGASTDAPDDTTPADSGSGGDSGQNSDPSNGFLPSGTSPGSGGDQPGGGTASGGSEAGGGHANATSPLGPPKVFPGAPVSLAGFDITAIGSGGVGVKATYDQNGTRFVGSVKLKLNAPRLEAGIVIDHGVLRSASLSISGAAGLTAEFEAATQNGFDGNIRKTIDVPIDITIPLGGPLPLSMTWRQTFILKTAFSAKHGSISARGDYSFTGGLGFRYRSGFVSMTTPSDVKADSDMVGSVDGASLGVTGIVLAYRARAIVGIGAFGFSSGLELSTVASWGVSRASDIGGIPCRSVTIQIDGSAGVGWSIPKPLAAVVNFFLRLFDAEIPSSGGFRSNPVTIAKGTGTIPDVSGCRTEGES